MFLSFFLLGFLLLLKLLQPHFTLFLSLFSSLLDTGNLDFSKDDKADDQEDCDDDKNVGPERESSVFDVLPHGDNLLVLFTEVSHDSKAG